MIDFHTHVLPKIDDGPKDKTISGEILKQELQQGVTTVVFTPHYYGKFDINTFLDSRKYSYQSMQQFVPDGMKIKLGAEVHITGINDPSYDTICKLAIEGTRCVLFEFPFLTTWPKNLISCVSNFIADTGYTPIIAHAERYEQFFKNPTLLSVLISMGCYIQVSTGAFLKKKSKKWAIKALQKGLVHCIGTDAHNITDRTCQDYLLAKQAVYDAGCGEEWENVQNMMSKILDGKAPRVAYMPMRKFLGMYV